MAYNRLCSRAMIAGEYHPESCRRCESPCKYGTKILHQNGMDRETRDTPKLNTGMGGSSRLRRCVKMFNQNSIIKR